MNFKDLKNFDVSETIGSVISSIAKIAQIYCMFDKSPKTQAIGTAISIWDANKDKKLKDITFGDLTKGIEAYRLYKDSEKDISVKPEVSTVTPIETPVIIDAFNLKNAIYTDVNDTHLLRHMVARLNGGKWVDNPLIDLSIINPSETFIVSGFSMSGMTVSGRVPGNGYRDLICVTLDEKGYLLQVEDQEGDYNSPIGATYEGAKYYFAINVKDLNLIQRSKVYSK